MCAGPQTKDKHMSTFDAALILAATLSNFSWLWPLHDRWFTND